MPTSNDPLLWGIHAGQTGDADTLFLQNGYAAVGWIEMGDLCEIAPSRDAFKIAVAAAYPTIKPGAIPN